MGKDRWSHGNRGGHKRGGFNRGGFGRGRGRSRGGFRGQGHNHRVNNDQWQKKERTEAPGTRLSEADIGVTEYMSDHEGFNGIIKLRFSDFQVSEINEQGEVAKLTDMTIPEQVSDDVMEDEDLILNKYNVEILPMATWDQINAVILGQDPNLTNVEIDVTTSTKEERTRIHEAVKKAFGESIIASTVNDGDVKKIRLEKYRKGARFDRRVKWTWEGEYVHFVLHKENCDTMEAASKIIERLKTHVKPIVLGYAGTKDRRGKTSQWFSLKKVEPKKIANVCAQLNMLHAGNYTFKDYGLKLGMLKGNKFRIALRNVTADDGAVSTACSRLAARGFINYYGLQRFGTRHDLPTHLIGKLLLQGNYKEAIDTILSPRSGPLYQALSLRLTEGPQAAANVLPRYHSSVEAKLLTALAASGNDLLGALFKIPRNTRLLYLHAYQSWQWNRCVSERLRRLGLRPAAGDLVPLAEGHVTEDPDDCELDPEERDQDPDAETEQNQTEPKKEQERIIPVKVLTQEDIDNKTYTIFDVVMPLAGYLVQYPPNMRDYYETLLKEDGLTLDLKHKNKNYSMSGAYRRVAILPADVRWECPRYSNPLGDLVLSDWDELRGTRSTCAIPHGKYKAVVISFTLPSSCYATMALRELLKVDTSSDTQAAQNNYHKRRLSTSEDNDGKRMKNDCESDNLSEKVEESVNKGVIVEESGNKGVILEESGNKIVVLEDSENKGVILEDSGNKSVILEDSVNKGVNSEESVKDDKNIEKNDSEKMIMNVESC